MTSYANLAPIITACHTGICNYNVVWQWTCQTQPKPSYLPLIYKTITTVLKVRTLTKKRFYTWYSHSHKMCYSLCTDQTRLTLSCYMFYGSLYTVHYFTTEMRLPHILAVSRQSHISTWAPFALSILTRAENEEARNDNSNNLQFRRNKIPNLSETLIH